jgi:hypothetical protein
VLLSVSCVWRYLRRRSGEDLQVESPARRAQSHISGRQGLGRFDKLRCSSLRTFSSVPSPRADRFEPLVGTYSSAGCEAVTSKIQSV